MNVAIIPARSGSKRIPEKNFKPFMGEPIILRTIRTLQSSKLFDQIIISTDSDKIAETTAKIKDLTISYRDEQLSNDKANIIDVMSHETTKSECSDADAVCCTYATNPFLNGSALKLGLQVLHRHPEVNYVSSVTTYPFPIQRSLGFSGNGDEISMNDTQYLLTHSQNLEPRFHEAAQFWWGLASTWKAKKPMQEKMIGIYIPRWMTQDLDNLEDWEQAEIRWEVMRRSKKLREYKFDQNNVVTRSNF